MNVGEFVAEARRRKGLSLRELARLTGIQNSHLSELETGRRANPTWKNILKITKALDLKISITQA